MADGPPSESMTRDARDLRRGVLINLFGYLLKMVHPAGVVLIVALYGDEAFGVFFAAQQALLLLMRVCLLGLDKGVLWWVARQPPTDERRGLAAALGFAFAISTVLALALVAFAAPWVALWWEEPTLASSLQWIALAVVPMTVSEVLISAALGKRRMEAQVFVKDGVVPLCFVALALGLGAVPSLRPLGLPVAFVSAQVAGLFGAIWAFSRAFSESRWPRPFSFQLPRPLVRYAFPMWGAEVANSFLQRVDTLILAALTDPATVGIYAVVMNIGNALRTIRRAFDPIVLSIVSQIGARKDRVRLRAGVSYATSLVMITQMPVYAFIVAFAPMILAWMGHTFEEGFDQAIAPIIILSAFWSVNGIIGLQGVVVTGYGRSDLAVINVLVALGVQVGLLWLLIPPLGLEGAAYAVGIATMVQNALALVQSRIVTGGWNYDPRLSWLLVMMVVAGAAMAVMWLSLLPVGEPLARVVAFCAFMLSQGGFLLWLRRTGRLIGSSGESGSSGKT